MEEKNKRINLGTVFRILLGILIISIILYKLDLKFLVQTLSNIDLRWFFIVGIIFFTTHLLMAYRIWFPLRRFYDVSFSNVFWIHLSSFIFSQITPGRLGYFSIGYLLKKNDVPYSFSSLLAIFSQVISMTIQFVLAGLGVFYLISIKSIQIKEIQYIILSLIWILIVILSVLFFIKIKPSKLSFLLKRLPFGKKINEFLDELNQNSSRIKNMIPMFFIVSFLGWLVGGFGWLALGHALKIDLPLLSYFVLNPMLSCLTFIPITPGGLGIAEGGTIIVFSLFGIRPEIGFIFMMLDRFINIFIGLLGLSGLVK